MKLPSLRALVLVAALTAASEVRATITMTFSELVLGRIASGFGNATATTTGTNGMNWGIVVDTGGGSSFASGSYTSFAVGTAGFLSTPTGVTDDYYFPAYELDNVTLSTTFDTSSNTESGGASGGNGTIGTVRNVPLTIATGIQTGQRFAIIWFSSNSAVTGARYGFFTDSTFTIPTDGQTESRSTPFAGTDPIRPATQTIIPVPEPSSLLYLSAGTLLLARRRSRR